MMIKQKDKNSTPEMEFQAESSVWHVGNFTPFEATIICPECNRPLALMISSVYMSLEIHCPRCRRSLTSIIRRIAKNGKDD